MDVLPRKALEFILMPTREEGKLYLLSHKAVRLR